MMLRREPVRNTARTLLETVDAALFQRKLEKSAKLAIPTLSHKKDQTHHHNHHHALLKLMMPRREHQRNTAKTLLETVDAAHFQRKLEKSAKLAIPPLSHKRSELRSA